MNGSSAEYIDGAGNLQTFPTIPQGDITDVNGGTYITTVNSTGPVVTVKSRFNFKNRYSFSYNSISWRYYNSC